MFQGKKGHVEKLQICVAVCICIQCVCKYMYLYFIYERKILIINLTTFFMRLNLSDNMMKS